MSVSPTQRHRFLGRATPAKRTPVRAEAPSTTAGDGGVVTLRLYEPIDSWGDLWGVSAKEFTAVLDDLGDDVEEIRLHVNSPGGEVFEGIAILNALRGHKATVTAIVEGVAASAAGFIAVGCDRLVMARNSELMIHDAWGVCVGNAEDMRDIAGRLDQLSDNVASIYAEKAGGDVADWRAAMRAETWYSAEEAAEAGLADEVAAKQVDDRAKARFDLSVFAYAGRGRAPAPQFPESARAAGSTTEGSPAVAFSDEQITTLRQRVGVAADADEDTILAALEEALAERADPPEQTQPAGTADILIRPVLDPASVPPGMTLVEADVLTGLQAAARRGEEARAQQEREERDRTITSAVRDGKITPARRNHWQAAWDSDPDGTRATLESLPKNLLPVAELGHDGESVAADAASVRNSAAYQNWSMP